MKKEGIFVIAIIILIFLIASLIPLLNTPNENVISSFQECVDAGNPVLESYPRKCVADGKTFIEEIENKIYCSDSERNVDACIEIYDPVCGFVQVECVTEPCNPIPETFSNSCFACMNERVIYYVEGECQ